MKRLLTVLLCAVTFGVAAQQGVVTGRVVDARTGEYIEYANVALLKAVDSSLVNGTVSEVNGGFAVTAPSGRYLLRVTFMGYDTYFHAQTVTLGDGRREVNVGKVKLKAHAKTMEAVEISAERSMVEYQLDKRVINVDKNLVTGGGTLNATNLTVHTTGNSAAHSWIIFSFVSRTCFTAAPLIVPVSLSCPPPSGNSTVLSSTTANPWGACSHSSTVASQVFKLESLSNSFSVIMRISLHFLYRQELLPERISTQYHNNY